MPQEEIKMHSTFSKETKVKKKHYGDCAGTHSGYTYAWTMNGKKCECATESGIRGTSSGVIRINDDGISFAKATSKQGDGQDEK